MPLHHESLVGKTIATFSMNIHACWSSETPWLCHYCCSFKKYVFWPNFHKHHCCSNMPTGRTVATQSVCLPTFCHSILHACWCCTSLSAIPACNVSRYQRCLLVRCLTIGHTFWCDDSLSAMLFGVLSHLRSCPLEWCLTKGHVCWYVATGTDISTSWV